MSMDFNHIPFVPARWYKPATGRDIRKIVIHSMEAPEKCDTAEATARYFATTDREASAHFNVDNNSVVQSVQCKDVAYAAPGANHDGIHIELAGYARQTRADWEDAYSDAMLGIAAELIARVLIPKFKIPILYLSASMMAHKPDLQGITTHAQVSAAFKRSTHTDPGLGFPITSFLDRIRSVK